MEIFRTASLPGRIVTLQDGRELLWFSGTDYLGMGHNEEFRKYLLQGFNMFGNHYGSSRNNSLQLNIYPEAEQELASFTHAPAALIVSSGMWAGQLAMKEIEAIAQKSGVTEFHYHYAPGAHPAIRGNQYRTETLDWREWALKTVRFINENLIGSCHIVVSDAVGSPWVEKFDFSIFSDLRNSNVWFIIDDSHGLGVVGAFGRGIYQQLHQFGPQQLMVTASLNKALGVPAGVLLAEPDVINRLHMSPWFSAASPPLPASMYALKRLLEEKEYDQPYRRVIENTTYLQNKISGCMYLSSVPDYPVICSNNAQFFDYLLANGILASRFPYPSAGDEPVTRIAISALHQKDDLDRMAEVCISFQNEFKS